MVTYTIGVDLIASNEVSPVVKQVEGSLLDLEQSQDKAATGQKRLSDETSKSSQAMGQFKSEITGVIAGFGLFAVLDKAGEFMEMGKQVNVANATFTALSGGAEQAAVNLTALQDSTGGVVDNMVLMNGANRLMLMGLASDTDEMSKLTEMAVTLGRAMGNDAGQSIQDFAALLANQSIPRLDNFGISSDKVRAKIQELKDAGVEAGEAFKLAVLDEGTASLERLGSAAEGAISPIDRMGVSLQNALQGIAASARTSVDGIAGILEVLGQFTAQDIVDSFVNPQALADRMKADAVMQQLLSQTQNLIPQTYVDAAVQTELDAVAAYHTKWDAIGVEHSEAYWGSIYQYSMNRGAPTFMESVEAMLAARGDTLADAGQRAADIYNQSLAAQTELGSFMSEAGGMGKYATQEQADALASSFEHIKELGDAGLISDDDVRKAGELRDSAQEAADALANLKLPDVFGQTAGGLAGQITDDLMQQMQASGQYTQEQLDAMQQQLDLSSGRETGASVTYQQDVLPLLKDIASLSPEDAVKAVQNLQAFMQMASMKGLTPDQMAKMMPMATGYGYTGAGGSPFTVKSGQTPGEVAAGLGISVEALLGYTGAANAYSLQPGTYSMGAGVQALPGFSVGGLFTPPGRGEGGEGRGSGILQTPIADMVSGSDELVNSMSEIKVSTAGIASDLTGVSETLETMTRGVHTVNIKANIEGLDQILALLDMTHAGAVGASGTGKTKTVRDSGGFVSGVDQRTDK